MPFILIIIGGLVTIGWIFDIGFLRSINPSWTPMKFATAICFMMSGLIIFSINKIIHGEFEIAPLILSAASLTMIIFTAIFFLSNFFKISIGIEQLFVGEIFLRGKNLHLQPCSASMFNFLIIAIVGIVAMYKIKVHRMTLLISGILISLIGLSAVIGHLLHVPFLYFDIPGISSAMAVFSGPLFVLIGVEFYLLYSCQISNNGFNNLKKMTP